MEKAFQTNQKINQRQKADSRKNLQKLGILLVSEPHCIETPLAAISRGLGWAGEEAQCSFCPQFDVSIYQSCNFAQKMHRGNFRFFERHVSLLQEDLRENSIK